MGEFVCSGGFFRSSLTMSSVGRCSPRKSSMMLSSRIGRIFILENNFWPQRLTQSEMRLKDFSMFWNFSGLFVLLIANSSMIFVNVSVRLEGVRGWV